MRLRDIGALWPLWLAGAAIVALILALALHIASQEEPRECLRSHTGHVPVLVGKTLIFLPHPICDEYAPPTSP